MADFIIDFETLGVSSNAAPLNLSVIAFELDQKPNVNALLKKVKLIPFCKNEIKSDFFSRDAETLHWWKRQSDEVKALNLKSRESDYKIKDGLNVFMDYLKSNGFDLYESIVWARGTDFDIPILKTLFTYANIPYPIRYNKVRDIRTYIDILGGSDSGFVYLTDDKEKELSVLKQHFSAHDVVRDAYVMQYLYLHSMGEYTDYDNIPF